MFVLLWSTGFIGARLGLPHIEPLTFLSIRYEAVIACMAAIALATRAPWPASAKAWMHIGVSGLLVLGVYLGGVFIVIHQGLPAGVVSLVVSVQPLLTAVGAGYLLGAVVLKRQWPGLAWPGFGFTWGWHGGNWQAGRRVCIARAAARHRGAAGYYG